MASDPDCLLVWLFDKLFARGIWYHQGHLSEPEEILEDIDWRYEGSHKGGGEATSPSLRDDLD